MYRWSINQISVKENQQKNLKKIAIFNEKKKHYEWKIKIY